VDLEEVLSEAAGAKERGVTIRFQWIGADAGRNKKPRTVGTRTSSRRLPKVKSVPDVLLMAKWCVVLKRKAAWC
jgi:hypothetical protein